MNYRTRPAALPSPHPPVPKAPPDACIRTLRLPSTPHAPTRPHDTRCRHARRRRARAALRLCSNRPPARRDPNKSRPAHTGKRTRCAYPVPPTANPRAPGLSEPEPLRACAHLFAALLEARANVGSSSVTVHTRIHQASCQNPGGPASGVDAVAHTASHDQRRPWAAAPLALPGGTGTGREHTGANTARHLHGGESAVAANVRQTI